MTVNFAYDTDSFGGEGLLDDFGGALGSFAQTVADEGRVGHLHQNVIHTIDVNVLDPALLHIVQYTTISQRTVQSSIAVYQTTKVLVYSSALYCISFNLNLFRYRFGNF